MVTFAVQRSKNWLAVFYHRIKSKAGAAKAITATARKIAVIFYTMMCDRIMFNPISMESYVQSFKERQLKRLEKQAKMLGMELKSLKVT
jgi:hypothetical protein